MLTKGMAVTEKKKKAALQNDIHKNIKRTGKIMIEISGEGREGSFVCFVRDD